MKIQLRLPKGPTLRLVSDLPSACSHVVKDRAAAPAAACARGPVTRFRQPVRLLLPCLPCCSHLGWLRLCSPASLPSLDSCLRVRISRPCAGSRSGLSVQGDQETANKATEQRGGFVTPAKGGLLVFFFF